MADVSQDLLAMCIETFAWCKGLCAPIAWTLTDLGANLKQSAVSDLALDATLLEASYFA